LERSALAKVALNTLERFVGLSSDLLEELFEDGLFSGCETPFQGQISENTQEPI
jgi:hypothetical protein